MKNIYPFSKTYLVITTIAFALVMVLSGLSMDAFAQPDKAKGPKCQYRDLDSNKIISYDCDRFQSKGDIDAETPQIKIVSPKPSENINYALLEDSDMDGDKEFPITIVVSDNYLVAGALASGPDAVERYSLPQVSGVGHAHAYCAPVIDVTTTVAVPDINDTPGGNPTINISGVEFVADENRSDFVCGFCVFGACTQETGYQVCSTRCELQGGDNIEFGEPYRVIVDTTQNSHDPRMKHHPRDVPPGDQVIVTFTNPE